MFKILACNCNETIIKLLDNYKKFNLYDVAIFLINDNELESHLDSKQYNLLIINHKQQDLIYKAKEFNAQIIVIGNENEDDLEKSYQHGALVYVSEKNFINVYKYIIDQFKDIYENQELSKQKIENLINLESLTQLPNRAKLIETLQKNTHEITAISIIDINSFKEINDFYGHSIGDFILKSVANLISNEIRSHSNSVKLYKFPSDTYCITSSTLSKEDFEKLIQKVINKIESVSFVYQKNDIHLRATAGISFSQKQNKLITADLALQTAKKNLKDYEIFYEELDNLKEYQNNMLWTKKIKNALINDNITVYFQPLIDNKTLEIVKYECLVRLIDESDNSKVVSPFFFLDVSKKSKQYNKITKAVVEKSIKTFSDLPYEFSINISYEDIADPDFYDHLVELLSMYPNVSNTLVFEILEDENIKNYDIVINFISKVKALGCKIAIDDFGSGYSNFDHILKMDADFLKIDASLIKNITKDRNSYIITKTIVKFAQELNLKTIAEYVENEEIFNVVKQLGIDYSQGYYFSAPVEKPEKSN